MCLPRASPLLVSSCMVRITSLFPVVLALLLAGCTAPNPGATYYVVTTQSSYQCCRTIRYSTWTFSELRGSTAAGDGVSVRLHADTLAVRCSGDAGLGVTISNNSGQDIYIPFSHDLEGSRIKLYPWRLSYDGDRQIRLARQLQYNDIVEREDALSRFFLLPAGKEVALQGVITPRWLCSAPEEIPNAYLEAELNPTYYSDRSRALRAAEYRRDPNLPATIGLRYEVAYTTLEYFEGLPVLKRESNPSGDTVNILIGVKDEPADFLNASQRVASSNVVTLRYVE